MAQNKSLSTQEVADILHVSKSTIYDLIRRGEIHSYKIGRKVRFTQDDVDAYIARSRHEHSTRPVKRIDTHSTLLTPPEQDEPEIIISGQDALLQCDNRSILIVVDTNRPDQVEFLPLLEAISKVCVVDHHRRAADYISPVVVNLHEPYASSAAELTTEM